ncbi:MAG TPA: SgcJ/EcaC family oxidoreductase [Caulobacteraceae bacterium]|jgi:PhnB protein|nr:SgcJ/EcaC family oxidoreductase [Caulobacteraceae bacterium]
MNDDAAIRALIDRYSQAIHDKDAEAMVACYTDDAVGYDLAQPLAEGPETMRNPAGMRSWFTTWATPISSVAGEMTVRVGGDVAYAFTLRHMTGVKTEGTEVDLWFRATAGFRKQDGEWRIAHIHNSVPFAMDGSGRALLDLKP